MNSFGAHLERVRRSAPLVHSITNFVAMNSSANVLLAVGASPAMVHGLDEVAEFAALAHALSINIGTVDTTWAQSMEVAADVMRTNGRPWLLDPVGIGATQFRRHLCARLLARAPTVVRGNASEILALNGTHANGKGTDAADPVSVAECAARQIAKCTRGVVVATGQIDYATDGERSFRIANGHPLMTRVTAIGCSLTSVIAAFTADKGEDALDATVAALAYYGLAGQLAAERAAGPGRFFVEFLDALYAMDADTLNAGGRVERA